MLDGPCISHRFGLYFSQTDMTNNAWQHFIKTLLLFCSVVTRSAKKVFSQLIGWQAAVCVATAARDQVDSWLASSGVSCGAWGTSVNTPACRPSDQTNRNTFMIWTNTPDIQVQLRFMLAAVMEVLLSIIQLLSSVEIKKHWFNTKPD